MVKTVDGDFANAREYVSDNRKSFVLLEIRDKCNLHSIAMLTPVNAFKLGLLLLRVSIIGVLFKE